MTPPSYDVAPARLISSRGTRLSESVRHRRASSEGVGVVGAQAIGASTAKIAAKIRFFMLSLLPIFRNTYFDVYSLKHPVCGKHWVAYYFDATV